MAIRVSDVIGVTHLKLEAQGALDAFIDIDSQFHIHPAFLYDTKTPELETSQNKIEARFKEVIHLLGASAMIGDLFFERAVRKLIFPEISLAAIGYAKDTTAGRAIGLKLARQIATTAFHIIKAGIKDPAIFEIAGLYEENIGSDLLSDMCLWLIIEDILAFNDRISGKLKIPTIITRIANRDHLLPLNKLTNKGVLLLPREILSPLPVATCWDDISTVSAYNEGVRQEINKRIGRTWGNAARRLHKSEIKNAILKNPDLLRDLLEQYRNNPHEKYDYESDPLGEIVWYETTQEYGKRFPIRLPAYDPSNHKSVLDVIIRICEQYKKLIESNGLFKLLYDHSRTLKPERAAQLLFYGIADVYCSANNIDLSREPDAGRGPVDFKASRGYKSRVLVEVKYAKSNSLLHGFEKQLPVYEKAEQSFHSIYLVIQTPNTSHKIKKLTALRSAQIGKGKRAPDIILVDGSYQRSASNV